MLFKWGSGRDEFFDVARSKETLTGRNRRPVSFMKGFDAFRAVKSGGKTAARRKCDPEHRSPIIVEFIECKMKEERKAHV